MASPVRRSRRAPTALLQQAAPRSPADGRLSGRRVTMQLCFDRFFGCLGGSLLLARQLSRGLPLAAGGLTGCCPFFTWRGLARSSLTRRAWSPTRSPLAPARLRIRRPSRISQQICRQRPGGFRPYLYSVRAGSSRARGDRGFLLAHGWFYGKPSSRRRKAGPRFCPPNSPSAHRLWHTARPDPR